MECFLCLWLKVRSVSVLKLDIALDFNKIETK